MEDLLQLFLDIGYSLEGSVKSQMFGKECFKINHKAYTCFYQNNMVFKLTGEAHKAAIALEGAELFDPGGIGRRMKEWVIVPGIHKDLWPAFARAARAYTATGVKA
ncbi:MAG TPA: hypothetical protein VK172_11070 [Lentimicrobium sp.]|nr:hypothetical protein [Lentimicrobium sp.]